jgi:putative tryptophan/tyrosine transport system substrate-binding protein
MKRRAFITLLGGAAAAWPLAAQAQQPGKLPTIGFLGANTPDAQLQWTTAFVQRLRELGWIEDRTVAIKYRWAEGRLERMAEIAQELVRLKVDVIFASSGGAVLAVKQATSAIPTVFPAAGDPVASGLVASLARPGGNITGLSIQQTDVASKRLELLRELLPELRHLAVMGHAGASVVRLEIDEIRAAAGKLGLDVAVLEIRRTNDIMSAFDSIKGRAQALYVITDPLLFVNRLRINTLALGIRMPTIHGFREYVQAAGLMSYGPNFPDLFRRSAELVDKILRGTKPADIPVEQPTKFDLVVNLITAKALGLTVPPTLLARADEVIE